ncbi:PREDICTED: putative pentatricopeptide repeat-containing protein At1g69350, mitochondrial [Tarenaya hassleriana]|uniref:putative pentatricopeptide repeat-containing protein At1g69350, mitochondrial n=1 Tax=Tarenaya hassleriana TaxID=28532 RepID=UPI00053C1C44|nr:PREDICTED: putative pentatricopeptide repeat-containing protein At1g69350, mitochondrial [Tarenaya hassleriana]
MTQYMPLFRSCTSLRSLTQLHSHLLVTGRLRHDPQPVTKLIESYSFMGSPLSSRLVFEAFPYPDSFMYGVLIKCHVWCQFLEDAIDFYHRLVSDRTHVSKFVFPSVLRACAGSGNLAVGRKLHARIIKAGVDDDAVIETSLLCMYGETGRVDDAKKVFDEMTVRDIVAWSTIVSSYVENLQVTEGLEMFRCMVEDGFDPDSVTMISVVEGCAELGCLKMARSVHGYLTRKMLDLGESLGNSVLTMYTKCGDLFSAEKLFAIADNNLTGSWTSMISGYNRAGRFEEALTTFASMVKTEVDPNSVTLYSVLGSCGMLGRIRDGKSVHCFALRRGIDPEYEYIAPAVVQMYTECRRFCDAEKVLLNVGDRNIVSWNFLVSLYAQNGIETRALSLLRQMVTLRITPDSFALASSISACEGGSLISHGKQIHGHIMRTCVSDEFVQNSLINMYSKCGFVDSAYIIFNRIRRKSVVAWNSMIWGLTQNGNSLEAINLFDRIYYNCLKMNQVTFLAVIQACSNLGYLEKGKWVHHKLISYGINNDLYIDTALIDMYGKCGDLVMAENIFRTISGKSIVSWSSMINSYGIHGRIESVISTFKQMVDSGIEPNGIVFMNILSACSHTGSVEEGKFYFNLMERFDIKPNSEHFACLIDLLSRAGNLEEAYRIIKSIPFLADSTIWGSLVNGCRIHRRIDIIKAIKSDLVDIVTNDTGYYTLLSNVYAEEGEWEESRKTRLAMRNSGLKKVPGYSIIEIDNKVFRFGAGDKFFPGAEGIYQFLGSFQNLSKQITDK